MEKIVRILMKIVLNLLIYLLTVTSWEKYFLCSCMPIYLVLYAVFSSFQCTSLGHILFFSLMVAG